MNVIIANKYKEQLANLNVEVIKRMDGVFSVDEIIDTFQNFFYNKMILDLTAIDDYNDLKNIQKLSISLDMSKIIFLLPAESNFSVPSNLSKLIAMGIYNFTASVEGIMYLYNNPNSYRDVAQYHQIEGTINDGYNSMNMNTGVNSGMNIQMSQKVIGVKNLTSHAGATTLIYMMYKHLINNYNILALEMDKRDFVFYNEKGMKSISGNEINKVIAENHDKEIILVDLNNNQMAENVCSQVIFLLEPSILKLNKLLNMRPTVVEEIRNRYVVLNKSLIQQKDLGTFEYETKIKPSYILGCIDDHGKSEEIYNFLRNMGFDRV